MRLISILFTLGFPLLFSWPSGQLYSKGKEETVKSFFKNDPFSTVNLKLSNMDTLSNDSLVTEQKTSFLDKYPSLSSFNCISSMDTLSPNIGSGYLVLKKGLELYQEEYKTSGSCWNYVNKIYDFAGFNSNEREVIYSTKKGTIINDPSMILPGDWLYHVNYSYRNVEHSAIFVCWHDRENLLAVTLSHVGQNKYAGGKFGIYDLKGVYMITRPKAVLVSN